MKRFNRSFDMAASFQANVETKHFNRWLGGVSLNTPCSMDPRKDSLKRCIQARLKAYSFTMCFYAEASHSPVKTHSTR